MTTKYKDLNEFERQILAGEITNFEPYFKNQNQTQLRILKQICIRHGVYQEAYTDWASNENDTWTQQILASNGYCLEILIHAKENYVREAVLKKDIRRALEPDIMENNLFAVRNILMTMTEPDRNVLDAFIQAMNKFKDGYEYEALYQKHTAYNMTPTTIEKTMTPLQLCKADNLLWTQPYSGNQIALANNILRDPLNNLTAEFVFNALDHGVQTSGELVSYTLYHQTN